MKRLLLTSLLCPGISCALASSTVDGGRVASFDGLQIAYDARGRGQPAVVFIHGWSCNRRHWDQQMDDLADSYRVVALDLGGHGDSGRGRPVWTLPSLARDVKAVVEELDLEEVILVGHSMGGPVALLAAYRLPGRVLGVIGVDTLHDADFEYSAAGMEPFLARLDADFSGACREFLDAMFPAGADPELVARVKEEVARADPRAGTSLMRSFVNLDLEQALADCPVPVRCINAAAPYETKVAINRQYAPGFQVALMDGVGHFPMLERPQEFNALLRAAIVELTAPGPAAPLSGL